MLSAVRPHRHRCAFGIHVTFKLLDAVFTLGLFTFDDDFRRGFAGIAVNDNVRRFGADFGTELHTFFQINLIGFVAVLMNQLINPKLTDNFSGLVLPSST